MSLCGQSVGKLLSWPSYTIHIKPNSAGLTYNQLDLTVTKGGKMLLRWEKIKSKGRNLPFLKPTGCCISNIWLDQAAMTEHLPWNISGLVFGRKGLLGL